jgi:hypothetical protein
MLFELKLNEYYNTNIDFTTTSIIIKSPKKQIINKEYNNNIQLFETYIKQNSFLLDPYYYLKSYKQPIYYFIFKEIINKYNLNKSFALFSNLQTNINCIEKIFPDLTIYTNNKLCSHKKTIIHNYNIFIKSVTSITKYNTIIIHYDNYKKCIMHILISLILLKQGGTLIINLPNITYEENLTIINFLMNFYNISIIKPFVTPIYSEERYIICENYKHHDTSHFFNYISCNINKILNIKTFFLISDTTIPYYFLKKIIQDNSIWSTYILNTLCTFMIDNDLKKSDKQNKIIADKWVRSLHLSNSS